MLDLPADAEQVRVVAGEADDPAIGRARRRDEEVAVGDPARERGQRQVAPGQLGEPAERLDERVVQLAAEDRRSVTYADRRLAGGRVGLDLDRVELPALGDDVVDRAR